MDPAAARPPAGSPYFLPISSTLTFSFSSRVSFSPLPYMSTLAAMAAFAATALAIFPLCHLGAECTMGCWKSSPCLGGCDPVFSARKRAFSAPRIWMVLAGNDASFFRPPAFASSLAPTASPRTADRLGAAAPICSCRCASSLLLSSPMPRICPARACTAARFSSDMSPPLLLSRISSSISTLGAGNPAPSNVPLVWSPLLPAPTIREYPPVPSITLSSSGKWRPYHSLMRAPSALEALSTSSRAPTAWMMWRSGLADSSVTLLTDSDTAKSRSFCSASPGSLANPASTSSRIFPDWISSARDSSIIRESTSFFFSRASRAASFTSTPIWIPSRCLISSFGTPLDPFTARYCPRGSENGTAFVTLPPSETTIPISVRITECM